jgi:peptidoglycan/xylan/chitin deacetylase (PgdA/CDA1 family)
MKRAFIAILSMIAAVWAGVFCMRMVYAAYDTPLFDDWILQLTPEDTFEEYVGVSDQEIELPSRAKRADGSVVVPVLMYHQIRNIQPWHNPKERLYTVSPDVFEKQMEAIKSAGYNTITPDELASALEDSQYPLPPNPVLLAFDDGHREHYSIVYPILKRLGLKATYYIITLSNKLNGYMNDAMIREVSDSGIVTIGSHTRHHAALNRLSAQDRKDEIYGSKMDLESLLGTPVTSIAYPYGYQSEVVQTEVEAAGYSLGFGIGPGSVHNENNRYNLRRIQINQNTDVVNALERFSDAK